LGCFSGLCNNHPKTSLVPIEEVCQSRGGWGFFGAKIFFFVVWIAFLVWGLKQLQVASTIVN
jgi:uncharacterized membrane protein